MSGRVWLVKKNSQDNTRAVKYLEGVFNWQSGGEEWGRRHHPTKTSSPASTSCHNPSTQRRINLVQSGRGKSSRPRVERSKGEET